MVPAAVLTQSKPVFITAVRPVSVDMPKSRVTQTRHVKPIVTKFKSPIRRHLPLANPQRPVIHLPELLLLRLQWLVLLRGNPQHDLKDKGVIDSGCSRHMTGNMSYLFDFKEVNGGYVAFRGNPKGGKIFGKGKIKTVDVVTTAKLIIEVVTAANEFVTAASAIITTAEAQVPAATTATLTVAPVRVAAAPSRRRKGVVIRDPEEESTTSTIILAETKSKDKGKGILVDEPKPLKKKQQIEQDEQYARELDAELNKDNDWDEAIDHVKRKAKEDPAMKKYQAMKRKPQTKAQARKNMMMYLKNVTGFKLDYFKGMSYEDIRLIFEAKFNSNVAFLLKTKEQIKEDENRALQKINETPAEREAKRRKLDKEVEDLKRHLQIITFTTTQLILLVERSFGVDVAMELKKNMLSV
nr:ribonuclease H-like domain-containing protein [Tanacetum cinerariifolium]